jgi:hypothetical protein
MDYGLINAFLALEEVTEQEGLIRQNTVSLNERMNRVKAETARLSQELKIKEQELLKVSGALENQLSVVEHLARQKGLEPLVEQAAEQTEEESSKEVE